MILWERCYGYLTWSFTPKKFSWFSNLRWMVINNQQLVEFAVRMRELFINNSNVIFLASDEAHFYLNGSVNKQNFCFWIPQNPCNLYEKPLQPKKSHQYGVLLRGLELPDHIFLKKIMSQLQWTQNANFIIMLKSFLRRSDLNFDNGLVFLWFFTLGISPEL